jgi:hypothetical protein
LTQKVTGDSPRRMGRKLLWPERMDAKLAAGTFARMDAALRNGEARTDLIREAVERELERREAEKSRKPG